jgi:hypothetical protein
MPEREYFSLRYLAPGFGFILVVIGLNYVPILNFLKVSGSGATDNAFSLVLSLASLLASSALGFLISQFWFVCFNHWRIDARIYERLDLKEFIQKRYKFEFTEKGQQSDDVFSAIMDYLILDDEKEWAYCQRKWDIYLLLLCTLVSLCVAVLVGLILRGVINWAFYTLDICWLLSALDPSKAFVGFLSLDSIVKIDVLLFVFTLVSVLILGFILYVAQRQVFREYSPMIKIFIVQKSDGKLNRDDLLALFKDSIKPAKDVSSASECQRA